MKTLNLLISSKNTKSLRFFLNVFYNNLSIVNPTFVKKKFRKTLKKTKITILKSPHVNKTAQEQFEIRTVSLQLQIYTSNIFKLLIFLKKLQTSLFADVIIIIKLIQNKKKLNLNNKKEFDIDNYYSNFSFSKFNKIQNCQTKKKIIFLNNVTENLIEIDSDTVLIIIDTYGKFDV